MRLFPRQCHEPGVIKIRNDCNDKVKLILKQCLNDTESLAFDKIEDIALRLYKAVCEMDQEKMKSKK